MLIVNSSNIVDITKHTAFIAGLIFFTILEKLYNSKKETKSDDSLDFLHLDEINLKDNDTDPKIIQNGPLVGI